MRAELEDSFAALAAAELAGLRRFGYAVCGDWVRADDLVQATLERMYRAWPRIHDVANLGGYARTVLARLAISQTRRAWWRREQVADEPPDRPVGDGADAVADRLDLAQALAGLTAKQRAAVVLRFVEDRPVAEVADILGIAPGTVKRQCHDALVRLRAQLHDESERVGPERSDSEGT